MLQQAKAGQAYVEDAVIKVMADPAFPKIVAEHDRLLNLIGNVEDAETIALVLLARANVIQQP